MNSTSLSAFFSTTRDFSKWVVDENRTLVSIPPFTVPIDYSPNSGNVLGILVEPSSRNYFIDSEGMSSGVIHNNTTLTSQPVSGSTNSLRVPNGDDISSFHSNISFSADAVAISFYVIQTNYQRPVIGYFKSRTASITIQANDADINIPASDIDVQGPMSDLSYRVRIRVPLSNGSLSKVSVNKPLRSIVGFNVARIQVEKDHWTSYIPTNGTAQNRASETVFRNLTHSKDLNEHQGAFDVVYTPTPGSKGSAMTVLKSDWSEYISFGNQNEEYGSSDAINFLTSSSAFPISLRYSIDNELISRHASAIRASYSGYGVRAFVRGKNKVAKLKDFRSFNNGKINRVQFGESVNGEHFCGTIHLFNGYFRTLNDEEMLNVSFTPNTSSADVDFVFDAPGVTATAASLFRTDQEAILYQNIVDPPTPERILAAWPRSSADQYFSDPDTASAGDSDKWFFDDVRYSFVQPANAPAIEQIFSPIKLDDFEFETILTSNASDDDFIGIVVAADYIDGELLSIVAGCENGGNMLRDLDNTSDNFKLAFLDSTTEHTMSHQVRTTILGSNNVMGGSNIAGSNVSPGWAGKQVKIKAIRRGAFLSVKVSGWDGADYLDDSEIVYNMNNLPRNGFKLLNPSRYGFATLSQADSTYLDYNVRSDQFTNDLKIYSQESLTTWQFVEGEWMIQQNTPQEDLLPATRINNPRTKERFIIDSNSGDLDFDRNDGISDNEAIINVPSNSTTDVPFSDIVQQFSFDSPIDIFNLYDADNVVAEQISSGGNDFVRIVSGASGGSFIVLLGTGTNETIAFRKVNVEVS